MKIFNPSLHGLRGIAALAVLIFHWGTTFPAFPGYISEHGGWVGGTVSALISFGGMGVLLFFVLSGFLITLSNGEMKLDRDSIGSFWTRRFLRIYPAVWAQLVILACLFSTLKGLNVPTTPSQWLSNITLVVNLPPYLPYPVNAVWWTLPIELGFYLIFPALLWLGRKYSFTTLLLLVLIVTLTWRILVMWYFRDRASYAPLQPWLDLLPGCLVIFVMGMYAARQKVFLKKGTQQICIFGAMTAFGLLMYWLYTNASSYWTGHWMLAIWNLAASCALTVIVWIFGHGSVEGSSWLSGRIPVFLGEISYGVYLWHFPVLLAFNQWTSPWQHSPLVSLLILAGILIPTLVLATISYYLIERPAMRWGKSLRS